MVPWKRNLVVVWVAQFCAILGFGMGLPFAPYYIQTLGIVDPVEVKFWSALFFSSACLPLAVMGPIWGMMADRYGRKLMLLRATFAASVILTCMGLVQSVELLIVLRFLQGALTGTVTASIALVVSGTPEGRHGYAMGWLSASVFSGMTTASFAGGLLADAFGYRVPFFLAGGLLLVSALVILFFAQENFVRPERQPRSFRQWRANAGMVLGAAMPILAILFAVSGVRQFDTAMFPLLVQELKGGLEGAASLTGTINACGALGSVAAGIYFGRLSDRLAPPVIGYLTAAGAGVFLLVIGLFGSLGIMFPARFAMYFFAGGMDPLFMSWLSRLTPVERQGTVMGLTTTARSLGWMVAPLASAWVASTWSLGMVYLVGPVLFWLLIPLIWFLSRKVRDVEPKEPAGELAG